MKSFLKNAAKVAVAVAAGAVVATPFALFASAPVVTAVVFFLAAWQVVNS